MKKIKKTVKKIPKKFVALVMVLTLAVTCVISITNVKAATTYGEGTGDYSMRMDITNTLGFTITSATINSYPFDGPSDLYVGGSTFHIMVSVTGNEGTGDMVPKFQYGGNWNNYVTGPATVHEGDTYTFVVDLTAPSTDELFFALEIVENTENQGQGQGGDPGQGGDSGDPGEGGGEDEHHFDGKAYVVWTCGSGVCYHYFDNIPDFDDGNSTFYKDTEVRADNDNSIIFDVNATRIGWVLKDDFERWVETYKTKNFLSTINWTQVDPMDIIGEPNQNMSTWEDDAVAEGACTRPVGNATWQVKKEFQVCVDEYMFSVSRTLPFVKLQPLNEPQYPNAHVSYGDRNFKVVIYNSDYRGVAMGNLGSLHYYPSSWTNPFVKRDQFDISGTTKNNPSPIDSILLEDTVNIKAINEANNFVISSIVPLDVPEDAVTVTPNNGEYSIHFASNFYDHVVFEVTDSNGGKSYMRIDRYTVDAYFKYTRDNRPAVATEFYFDRERDLSPDDSIPSFNNMVAQEEFEDSLGNPVENYLFDEQAAGGKGLYQAYFEYGLQDGEIDTIDKMYINAEYEGSSSSTYAGAYVGSGPGVEVKVYRPEGGE